ncbi:MAG: gamma-glutamyl-gamma-aminobutyrate hydrolase family protein [Actinobacteria bacterium]|nr:gamma-glutamyl-gamma-aminobutyrate hydrolase family protein [Actinomycetota bacterium]
MAPHVLIVGRLSAEAKNVRGEAFAGGQGYFHAVERAGGVPLLLPPIPSMLDRLPSMLPRFDALVLHGGGDVDPRRYGEQPAADELYGIVDEHDEVELAVVQQALAMDMPLLAICRGMQIVNVALGGTLVQHIGTDDHWFSLHPVDLAPGSRVSKAIGADRAAQCHSVHHQSVGRLGDGLTLVATADDGMPEAMEVDDARWAVCVQWHPEDTAATDTQQQALFDELMRQTRPE